MGKRKKYFKCGVLPDVSTTGDFGDVGHYTQMIWPTTTQCGCAVASPPGGSYKVSVCEYNPPGNWIGTYICLRIRIGNYKGNGIWAVDYNGNSQWDGPSIDRIYFFGSPTDRPVVGDWNNDGKDEIGNYKGNGIWAVDYNGNGQWDGTATDRVWIFGSPTDLPIVGRW